MNTGQRLLTQYLYGCSTVSIAVGVYGPLMAESLGWTNGYLAATSLVIATTLAIIARRTSK